MSILIKGMEMPKDCWSCPCSSKQYGYCEITDERFLDSRPQSCPIPELPPHGRLIDADAVYKRLQKQAMTFWKGGENPHYQITLEIMDAIRFAPTIIEAEENGNER